MEVTVQQETAESELEEMLCSRLWRFRLDLEAQAGQPITQLHAPAALLLSDLCVFAGLSEEQHAKVLGQHGLAYVNGVLDTRVREATSGRGGAARRRETEYTIPLHCHSTARNKDRQPETGARV